MDLILNILKQDHIYDIYIGVTGIIVAIVVFIAEVVKDQKEKDIKIKKGLGPLKW